MCQLLDLLRCELPRLNDLGLKNPDRVLGLPKLNLLLGAVKVLVTLGVPLMTVGEALKSEWVHLRT